MKMKKVLSLLLALALLVSLTIPVSAKQSFTDVGNGWSYKAVEYCTAKKYMSGEGAGIFNPGGKVIRAMVAQTLYNKAGVPETDLSQNPFTDVSDSQWFAKAVVWAKNNGVVAGSGDFTFAPEASVTRQQVCMIFYNYYCNVLGQTAELQDETVMESTFTDYKNVASWAKEAVRWANKTGFMGGDTKTTLSPASGATREQLAQFLMNFDKIIGEDVDAYQPPEYEQPAVTAKAPTTFTKTAAGLTVTGVEINPEGYDIRPVLANDKLYSTESAGSIVKRTNATVAVDGAFFNSYGDFNTSGTLISNGKLLKLYVEGAPYRPAFVVDSSGKASIEFFKVNQIVTLMSGGEKVRSSERVGCNLTLDDNDGTRMIYTRTYGSQAKGNYVRALEADASGKITKIYPNGGTNLSIPTSGYLLCERLLKQDMSSTKDTIFDECEVGDTLTFSYEYLDENNKKISTQDIVACLGNGPTLVKNGQAYCTDATFKQESFLDSHVTAESNSKMAIGIKNDGTVVIAHASCTLKQLAKAMAALGCKTAMNLDGGASCALYVNGSAQIAPGRNMSNMLVFTKK